MPKIQGSIRLTPEAWVIARAIADDLARSMGSASVAQAIEIALREKAKRDGFVVSKIGSSATEREQERGG